MKLHLGCGKRDFGSEWVHMDGGDYPHIQWNNITTLPVVSNSVEIIYASHVLEYFDREQVKEVLKEWNRVLKSNGILRLAVPDFEAMAKLYVKNNIPLEKFLGPLYGKMDMGDNTIYHKTVYDFVSLNNLLEECKFQNTHLYNRWETDHAKFDDHSAAYYPHMDFERGTLISLNVECNKT